MQLNIQITMDNAAFGEHDPSIAGMEASGILKRLASELELRGAMVGVSGNLRDHNGNRVGNWEVIEPIKTFLWIHDQKRDDQITVYQVESVEEEPTLVVPWTSVGHRNGFQAVREELARKGLISAAVQGKNGGRHYKENEARYFQL